MASNDACTKQTKSKRCLCCCRGLSGRIIRLREGSSGVKVDAPFTSVQRALLQESPVRADSEGALRLGRQVETELGLHMDDDASSPPASSAVTSMEKTDNSHRLQQRKGQTDLSSRKN